MKKIKFLKYLLLIVAMVLISSSCTNDVLNDVTVDPPTKEPFRTFVIVIEDIPELFYIAMDYKQLLGSRFLTSVFEYDYHRTITAYVVEKDVEWFVNFASNLYYTHSLSEITTSIVTCPLPKDEN